MFGQNDKNYQLSGNLAGGQPSVVPSKMHLSAINREVLLKSLQLEDADCSSFLAQSAISAPLSAGWICELKVFPALIHYSKISESPDIRWRAMKSWNTKLNRTVDWRNQNESIFFSW